MPDAPTHLPDPYASIGVAAPPPESDFGQEYSLLTALNKLVRDYSLGVGLFKEFIQNADDAEATEIRFILDQTTQTTGAFHNPKLAQLAGPALLVWNNALFNEQDIKNIRSLGDSEKVLKPASTGKFGLGFNTCYNLTDYPLLLTGSHIYLFDPHKTACDYSKDALPGKQWPLSPQLWSGSPGLLTPFEPVGLLPGQPEFPGTAFRLPLRTQEHDRVNGRIKSGHVTPDEIEELFQKFIEFAPSILVFLKHVLRVDFSIITPNDSVATSVLAIETENPEAVSAGRTIVNSAIKPDISATLQNLRSQSADSITSCFQHSVKLTCRAKKTRHDWLVCTGLFRGPDDTLLDAATELLDRKEKAIPWAGCACPVPVANAPSAETFQGHAFCFLPLPDVLGGCRLPVHVNGFFDVDTARKGLTHEASATGSVERLRAEWNRALIKEAVAAAYAQTLASLLQLDPQLDAAAFYRLWVDPKQNFPAPLDSLPAALFTKLVNRELIKSAAGNWQQPASLRLATASLRAPLIAEKWDKIPEPEIPRHICDGFAKAQHPIKLLEPPELRSFLETTSDINCPVAESPRPGLRNRDWLTALAQLAFTKAPLTKLQNLPLLLLADSTLHTIGHRAFTVFLAGGAERCIFANYPAWFVDADYADAVSFPEVPSAHVVQMTAGHVLTQLAAILPKPAEKHSITWDPQKKEPPNEQWLISVFQFFLDQPKPWKPDDHSFANPCLIPDQHCQLWPAGNNLTPLLLPPGFDPRLRTALETLGVQLVTGAARLLQAIEAFADRFGKVWRVSPRDLADTLHESRAAWSPKASNYDPAVCDPILQFFASKESLAFLAEAVQGQPRCDKLRQLPLFLSQSKELVAIAGNHCFIAAEVSPPPITLPIKLLRPGTWKELLAALEVQPLTTRAIIEDVILPNYAALPAAEQLTALAWIRDHLEEALTQAGSEQESLLTVLRSAPLILGSNDVLSRCSQLYVPNEKTIREVLGDFAVTPSEGAYGKHWDRWLPFFDRLRICKTPLPQHLALHIDRLKKLFEAEPDTAPATPEALSAAEQQLMSVLQHIVQNWSALFEGQVTMTGGKIFPFKDYLRTRAWCPPLRGDKNLKHLIIPIEPPAGVFPPTQLYPPILGHLVASLHPLLPLEQRDSIPQAIRDIAPEVVRPPLPTVTAHFTNLLANLNGNRPPDPDLIKTPLKRIYSYFGELEPMESVGLQATFATHDCIYVGTEGRFRKPKDTFRESVEFAEPWWSQVNFGPPEIEAGLTALGRKNRPDLNDLCRLTCEIHASTLEALGGKYEAQFIRILLRIQELLPDHDPLPDLCLLDRDGWPVAPGILFFHDATWLDDLLEESPVHLHHPQIPNKLLARLDLRRLSEHITTELEGLLVESQDREFVSQCEAIDSLLKTKEFATGLRRILSRSSIGTNKLDLDWLSQIRVSAVKSLECSHYVHDEKKLFLANSEEFFFRSITKSGGYTLSLSEAATDVIYEQVAVALQHWIGAEDLHDLSPLAKILQCPPARIESILDKLRVRRLDDATTPTDQEEKGGNGRSNLFDEDGAQQGAASGQQQQADGQEQGGVSERKDASGGQQSGGGGQQQGGDQQQTGGTGGGRRGGSGQRGGGGGSRSTGTGRRRDWGGTAGASRPQPKPKGRLLSYAATKAQREQAERNDDNADDELRPNKEIGDWAVHWVLQYERSQGRNADDSNHRQNKPGFDVISCAQDVESTRYIEVKGIDGAWDLDGVPLYPAQMDFALRYGTEFWLYVVEYARDPHKARIHTIQNPARKITQHRFDSGWQTEAAPSNGFKTATPAIGMNIQWHQDGSIRRGKIVHVSPQLIQVEIDNQLRTRIGIPNRPLHFELVP